MIAREDWVVDLGDDPTRDDHREPLEIGNPMELKGWEVKALLE